MEATESLSLEPIALEQLKKRPERRFERDEDAEAYVVSERAAIIRQFFKDGIKAAASLH